MKNFKVAVIGAGTMGLDIAFMLACYNYQVILIDINPDVFERAAKRIKYNSRSVQLSERTIQHMNLERLEERIIYSFDNHDIECADVIIENIFEDWDQKKALYEQINAFIPDDSIVAVNTSCNSITGIAALLNKPENVIGTHFMNPAYLIDTVEVIKGFHTSEKTIEKTRAFLTSIYKQTVLVNDFPGFVSNRLSHLFMNEAAFLIHEQIAGPKEVDLIFKKGYGHAMGPLETADLIGLDTVMKSLDVLYHSYQDTKYRCCPLLRKMVQAGKLGRKSGEGFFKYS